VTVPGEGSGARLDVFLARSLDLSRGYARRLLERGGIRLNGAPAAKGARVQPGDVVSGPPFRHPSEGPLASPGLEVRILAEKGGLLAVDKPAGVPTHPLDFDERGTVLSALLARYPEMSGVGEGGLRSGVVHRLDVGTSGVLVFARETEAWTRARKEFEERRVVKRYLARVHGGRLEAGEVALRLEHRGARMRVVSRGGIEAITWLRTLSEDAGSSLIEARPLTGVMHQIRATLAHLQRPVVGDLLYGSDRALGRHLLHATEIRVGELRAASPPPREVTEP
jgi:23S rRNA pseudouridine1911/1915/1917 synthase